MGFRMNIPLPGPFSYSVGTPKVGRAVRTAGKVTKAIAKDARQHREARDAQLARRDAPVRYIAPAPQYGPVPVRPAARQSAVRRAGSDLVELGKLLGAIMVLAALVVVVNWLLQVSTWR